MLWFFLIFAYNPARMASPAATLLKGLDFFTFSAPKIRTNMPVKSGMLDEPPVLTTASTEPGSRPEAARVSSSTFSTLDWNSGMSGFELVAGV